MANRRIALPIAVACILTAGWLPLQAQESAQEQTRTVAVTVLDVVNRHVGGLGREQFEIKENGVPVEATGFVSPDAPLCLAIVGEPSKPELKQAMGGQDELIEA